MFTGGRPFVLEQNSDKDGHAKKTLFTIITARNAYRPNKASQKVAQRTSAKRKL